MPDYSYKDDKDATGGLIQSPKVTPSGKPTQRSIKDGAQAADVVKTILAAGKNRAIVNSRIMAKINSERPYDQSKLENDGLGWRQNFTTRPLASLTEKVWPRFAEVVNNLKYFTDAKLPETYANATEKTEKFREIITKTIRNKKGWTSVLDNLSFDNSLFGATVLARLDEYNFLFKQFRSDEWFLSDGTKQNVQFMQTAVLKETFLPHELYQMIEDQEAAETAGWDVKKTIELINKASPAQIRDKLVAGGTLEAWYQNAFRELTVGASYMAGANVIAVYTLLVREVTGKISHYRVGGEEMALIFEKDDRFEKAEDCLAFFAFEKGNDTMAGSKGIGRQLYELAGMIDRTRNEVVDRAIMSGKTLVQGDIKRIHTFKMSVIGMVAIVPSGWSFLENKFDGNIEPFLKLDAYFSSIADQLVGAISPPKVEGEAFRSPAAWNMLAEREEENRDTRIGRFLQQFTNLIATMQKYICDPDTDDKDAKAAQEELKKLMTPEEIKILANTPVATTIRDLTPIQRQLIIQIATEKRGNPLYNQRQLEVEDLTNRVGADFVKRVLLPANDPTEQAEQQRLQQLELMLITAGQPVPVSPRDNHLVHLNILGPVAEQTAAAIMQGQSETAILEQLLAHITEHFNMAVQTGIKPESEELKPFANIVKKGNEVLAQMKQLDAQAAQLQQQSQAHMQDDAIQSAVEDTALAAVNPENTALATVT